MIFKKRVELSAYAAGQAATALLIVVKYLSVQGEADAATALLAVAKELAPNNTVRVGPVLPNTPPLSKNLEPLIDLVEPIIKVVDAMAAREPK